MCVLSFQFRLKKIQFSAFGSFYIYALRNVRNISAARCGPKAFYFMNINMPSDQYVTLGFVNTLLQNQAEAYRSSFQSMLVRNTINQKGYLWGSTGPYSPHTNSCGAPQGPVGLHRALSMFPSFS